MKVSSLIEYLTNYLKDNGDVDLDVEFAGIPKTPLTVIQTQPHFPSKDHSNFIEVFRNLQEEKEQLPKSYWAHDYKEYLKFNDDYFYNKLLQRTEMSRFVKDKDERI